nr:DUF998 domain-containing protein [Candidatus Sigynarchaeota archaeon]
MPENSTPRLALSEAFIVKFIAVLASAGLILSFVLLLVAMSMYPNFSLVDHTLSRLGRVSLGCGAEQYFGQPYFNAAYIIGALSLIPFYAILARGSHVAGQKKARNAFCFLIIAACGLIGAGIMTDDNATFRLHLTQSGTFFLAAGIACFFFILEWWIDNRGARKWAVAYLVFLLSNVAAWILYDAYLDPVLGYNGGIPEFFTFVSFYLMNAVFIGNVFKNGPIIPMVRPPLNRLAERRKCA